MPWPRRITCGTQSAKVDRKAWARVVLSSRATRRAEQKGGSMSLFLAMPILAATGLYNPQVVDRHHHCMADPGSIQALYCPAPATPAAPAHHTRHAKK